MFSALLHPNWQVLAQVHFVDIHAPEDDLCVSVMCDTDSGLIFLSGEVGNHEGGALFSSDWWYAFSDLLYDRDVFEAIALPVPDGACFRMCDGNVQWTFSTVEDALAVALMIATEYLGVEAVAPAGE